MGKRSREVAEAGGDVVETKKSKKIKAEVEAETTLDETALLENAENGEFPKTRKDLMDLAYDSKLNFVSVIANPMADKKLAKKLFKLMRKSGQMSRKELLRIGLKDVQLRIRKGKLLIRLFISFFT